MFNEFMQKAIDEGKKAYKEGEVPVGAVMVYKGKVIAAADDTVIKDNNPTYHAEILAINEALKTLGTTYLTDCSLYVTKEPCIMCLGAVINTRIKRVYFGAYDIKYGAGDYVLGLMHQKKLNHYTEIYGGIMENECKKLLEDFFRCGLS